MQFFCLSAANLNIFGYGNRVFHIRYVSYFRCCLCLVCCPFLIEAHWFWLLCVGLCCALSSTYKAHCLYLSTHTCVCVCECASVCVYGFGSLHRQRWRVLLNLKTTPAPSSYPPSSPHQSYKHCRRKAKYHSNLWWYFIMHYMRRQMIWYDICMYKERERDLRNTRKMLILLEFCQKINRGYLDSFVILYMELWS